MLEMEGANPREGMREPHKSLQDGRSVAMEYLTGAAKSGAIEIRGEKYWTVCACGKELE